MNERGAIGDGSVVVTLDEGEEYGWLGRGDAAAAADLYEELAGVSLADLVRNSWELHIFDPVWGCNDRLLPAMRSTLEAVC